MKSPLPCLRRNDSSVDECHLFRDSVTELALDISPELVAKLRGEIDAAYRVGTSQEEKKAYFYNTACPEMVEKCLSEWGSGTRDSPLTQLLAVVVDSVPRWFDNIDVNGSFLPPQIAVRSTYDTLPSGPHVDGLINGEETEAPNVPFGIVGIYLDEVSGTEDGALVYWADRVASVRTAIASHSGKALAKSLCEIGRACNFSDDEANAIVGGQDSRIW